MRCRRPDRLSDRRQIARQLQQSPLQTPKPRRAQAPQVTADLERDQQDGRGMQKQVKNVDGTYQRASEKHPQLLPRMRLGLCRPGRDAKHHGGDQQIDQRQVVEPM